MQRAAAEVGIEIEIEHVENPRVEAEEHYYNAVHTKLLDLGLKPDLSRRRAGALDAEGDRAHRGRVIDSAIDPRTRWNPQATPAATS